MTPPPPRPPPPLAGRTGVAGVLSRVQESRNQMDNTMSSALRDLTGLMDSAREMVALAVRLRATMLSTGNAAGDVEGEQELEVTQRSAFSQPSPMLFTNTAIDIAGLDARSRHLRTCYKAVRRCRLPPAALP